MTEPARPILALVGSGEYLPGMTAVDAELLRRLPEPPRVVCLPTAAGAEGPARIAYWSRLGVDHFTRLGAAVQTVPVLEAASANDPSLAAIIAQANFVYLSGGRPDYLHRTLAGSRAWAAIQQVLQRGGILAGCSAGAMILGERFFGFPGWKPGFNLLPGTTIIPHFDEIPEALIKSMRLLRGAELTVLGVDGNTALVVQGEQLEVLGLGGVTIWTRAARVRYTQGMAIDTVLHTTQR